MAEPKQLSDEELAEITKRWDEGAGINPKNPSEQERAAMEAFTHNACEDMEALLAHIAWLEGENKQDETPDGRVHKWVMTEGMKIAMLAAERESVRTRLVEVVKEKFKELGPSTDDSDYSFDQGYNAAIAAVEAADLKGE